MSLNYKFYINFIINIMSLIISPWFGSLGNNVLQIIRAIHYAKINNYNIIKLEKHNAFSEQEIIISNNNDNVNKPTIKNTFFYPQKLNYTDPDPYIMREYFQTYIMPIFFVKSEIETTENDLYIHIRSGDSWRQGPYYVLPPLSYYEKIIESKQWNRIEIINEDNINPCVRKLKEKNYKNINFTSGSLINDINIMKNCQNLAIGFGTFGLLFYFLSKNIKTLYIPRYVYDEMPKGDWGINMEIIDMPGYIKCGEWNPWVNKERIVNIMLNYKL